MSKTQIEIIRIQAAKRQEREQKAPNQETKEAWAERQNVDVSINFDEPSRSEAIAERSRAIRYLVPDVTVATPTAQPLDESKQKCGCIIL